LTPIECNYQILPITHLVFVNVGEDSIMADDATMFSNPLDAPIEEEELKKTPFDVNVSQRSCKEKLSRRVVHTQIDRSTWDHQLFPNPHALIIYLEFIHARGAALERFEEC
jgi:hypothetical protein